jgi:hypothetical protein
MRDVRASAEARDARGNLDPPLRGRGELGQPSDPHPSPTPPSWQQLSGIRSLRMEPESAVR